MSPAFVPGPALPSRATQSQRGSTCPRMASADQVVNKYYPSYERNRAPVITIFGEDGISMGMPPINAFADVDKTQEPLFSYIDDDTFIPNKPVPPSPISWPAGDGRGVKYDGTMGFYSQPNLKEYGPFPDFFKRSCDG